MTQSRAPVLERFLDRGPTWGSIEIAARGYGLIRYRLTVFPPGISRDERMALRLSRTFPVWGVACWLVLLLALMTFLGAGAALLITTGVCLVAGAVALGLACPAHAQVRTLTVVRMVGINDAEIKPALDEIRALAEILVRAETRLEARQLTSVEHEAEVWQVYQRMGAAAVG